MTMRPLSFKKYTEANIHPSLRLRVHHQKEPVWNAERGDWDWHYNGVTVAHLYDRQTDRLMGEGIAACRLSVDMPSRKIGRAIAVGRALKDYYQPGLDFVQAYREKEQNGAV
jgi:hypothetical protein